MRAILSTSRRQDRLRMNMPLRPLAGQRGLIFGVGSEHSVARRCAHRASVLGARLAIVGPGGNSAAARGALAAEIGAPLLVCDIEDRAALAATVGTAIERTGGFDFVVHSIDHAPRNDPSRGDDGAIETYFRLVQMSCRSFTELARLCAPHMPRGAALVHINNLHGHAAEPACDLEKAVQAVLQSIVRYLALELGPWDLRVHAVSRGAIETRLASGLCVSASQVRFGGDATPANRISVPDLVDDCFAFLAGARAAGMAAPSRRAHADLHAQC
jgi:enoyl-[acyl-carrier protein] reductase I